MKGKLLPMDKDFNGKVIRAREFLKKNFPDEFIKVNKVLKWIYFVDTSGKGEMVLSVSPIGCKKPIGEYVLTPESAEDMTVQEIAGRMVSAAYLVFYRNQRDMSLELAATLARHRRQKIVDFGSLKEPVTPISFELIYGGKREVAKG